MHNAVKGGGDNTPSELNLDNMHQIHRNISTHVALCPNGQMPQRQPFFDPFFESRSKRLRYVDMWICEYVGIYLLFRKYSYVLFHYYWCFRELGSPSLLLS